jgi:hypothetical protein
MVADEIKERDTSYRASRADRLITRRPFSENEELIILTTCCNKAIRIFSVVENSPPQRFRNNLDNPGLVV